VFEPISRRSVTNDAISQIKDMILDGRLIAGQRLPSERALSEALGVSRPSVREAISSLVAMHILEVQHGAGTFVASLRMEELLRPVQFAVALGDHGWDDLFEVRMMIEPGAARLAAERASDQQLEDITACAARMHIGNPSHDEVAAGDYELHRLIVVSSDNGLLMNIQDSISTLAVESRAITVELPGVAEQALDDHAAIVEALNARDPDRAQAAMREHIEHVRDAALRSRVIPPTAVRE